MDEVVKGVRRDQRVRAQMKGDVTREATWRVMGPWCPVEPGLERKPWVGERVPSMRVKAGLRKVIRASPWRCGRFDALRDVEMWGLNQKCGRLQLMTRNC